MQNNAGTKKLFKPNLQLNIFIALNQAYNVLKCIKSEFDHKTYVFLYFLILYTGQHLLVSGYVLEQFFLLYTVDHV